MLFTTIFIQNGSKKPKKGEILVTKKWSEHQKSFFANIDSIDTQTPRDAFGGVVEVPKHLQTLIGGLEDIL